MLRLYTGNVSVTDWAIIRLLHC